MRKYRVVFCTMFVLFLVSCAKQESVPASSDVQHATIVMKDGTKVSGTVVTSTPSEITLTVDGGGNRTISMKQVRSVTYDEAGATAADASTSSKPVAAESHENHFHPERAAVQTKTYVVPVGTEVSVLTEETLDSATAVEGQTFAGEIASDVMDADKAVVIPHGSNAQIVIRSATKGGRFKGASDLVIDLQSVSIGGQQYALSTADLTETGKEGVGANKRTAEYVGGGAALGAIVGAIAGHGKGAAIGAGSGAGAGALTQILTKGGSIRIPPETVLTFKLDQPLRVKERK